MKKIILVLTLVGLVACKQEIIAPTAEVAPEVDSTELLIAKSDSTNKHLDSVTTVTVKKANTTFEKLAQQIEVYKREITKIKSVQKVQTEKIIYIHDTVTIVEKKNLFGKTKKTTVTKSAADSTVNEDINVTNETTE